ncbi:MAG: hypothetical protein WCO08_05275 [Actinomycetes bacterium]
MASWTNRSRALALVGAAVTALSLIVPISASQAAAPVAGGVCPHTGFTTVIANKGYTCKPVSTGSKKLVWTSDSGTTPKVTPSTKPSIGGGTGTKPSINGGGGDGPDGAGGGINPNGAAFAKYLACLKAAGVTTMPQFGRPQNGGASPAPIPTLSAKEKAAMAKCDSLRPQFGGGFGGAVVTPATKAYLACLNTNGLKVTTMREIRTLDRTAPATAKALAACASKLPARGAGGFGGGFGKPNGAPSKSPAA